MQTKESDIPEETLSAKVDSNFERVAVLLFAFIVSVYWVL